MGKNSLVKSTKKKKSGAKKKVARKNVKDTEQTTVPEETLAEADAPIKEDKALDQPLEETTAAQEATPAEPQPVKADVPEAGEFVDAVDEPPEPPPVEPEPQASVSYDPPPEPNSEDPMDKMVKIGIGVLALLFLLIIGASMSNSGKYYIEQTKTGIEVKKGKFAPLGEAKLLTLPGAKPPQTLQAVYSKSEVFPLLFEHYLDQADALLAVSGSPDFNAIKSYLKTAGNYACTSEHKTALKSRTDTIELGVLIYKANVAESRGTVADLESALMTLHDASRLDMSPQQSELIAQRIVTVRDKLNQIRHSAKTAAAQAVKKADATVAGKPVDLVDKGHGEGAATK